MEKIERENSSFSVNNQQQTFILDKFQGDDHRVSAALCTQYVYVAV